jgi:hypothetical protein
MIGAMVFGLFLLACFIAWAVVVSMGSGKL